MNDLQGFRKLENGEGAGMVIRPVMTADGCEFWGRPMTDAEWDTMQTTINGMLVPPTRLQRIWRSFKQTVLWR